MKNLFFTIALFLTTSEIIAKDVVDGYIIFANNDTLQCQILDPGSVSLFSKISIRDTNGKKITYKANGKEILGFGFSYYDKEYNYVLKGSDQNEISFFLKRIVGRSLNLYYKYYYENIGGGPSFMMDVFMFEDTNGRALTVSGRLSKSNKSRIKNFLNNNVDILNLFIAKVHKNTDLESFVNEANNL